MINLTVKTSRLGPIMGRHPWAFSGGLQRIPDGIEPGTIVKLINERGEFLASGYFNSYAQIAVRVWSYDEQEKVDLSFFQKRIKNAWLTRKKYLEPTGTDSYRLINSENDFLPGLIVDKYADYLVLQFHTQGIERFRNEILEALKKEIKPLGIYERSDILYRKIENLDSQVGLIYGSVPDLIEIKENNLKFLVNVKVGQKTGFFLDQREKRLALQKYCLDQKVLNCFSYTGGFSVYALAGGAKKVVSVDISDKAIELAKENVKLNGFNVKKCEFVCADVKKYLRELPQKFEIIILDPPAFIKNRHKKKEGIIGYKSINEMALKQLEPGNILVSCSCSNHLSYQDFRYLLSESGARAKRSLQILESQAHGLDHPELIPFMEGEYLKVFFLKIN